MKTVILVLLLAGVFPVGSILQTVECSGGTGDKAEHGGPKIVNVGADIFPPCQVLLSSSSAQFFVTENSYPSTWTAAGLTNIWTAAGGNNIYAGSSSTSTLITGPNAHNLDASNNWWGGIAAVSGGYVAPWPHFVYSLDGGSPFPDQLTAASSRSGIYCGDGYLPKDGGAKYQSQPSAHDFCWGLNDNSEYYASQRLYDSAYSTIYYFIMHCSAQADPERTLSNDLGAAGGAKQLSSETGRLQYRKWLLDTVLELRTDDGWFCFSVDALCASYDHYGSDIPAALAIVKFLIDNPRCQSYRSQFAYEYSNGRQNQIAVWGDTAKNNNMKYFDSTLPSFHMLGLDTLLNFASVHHYDAPGLQIITEARITSNPFTSETSLALAITREAYLHIEVLDLLGRKIVGSGYEGVFEPGSRTIPLKMASLASGTYFVRVSTANNELRTFKIVKNE